MHTSTHTHTHTCASERDYITYECVVICFVLRINQKNKFKKLAKKTIKYINYINKKVFNNLYKAHFLFKKKKSRY